MAKFKRLVLTELGETSKGYQYRISTSSPGVVTWTFYTEKHPYIVEIQVSKSNWEVPDKWLIVDFGVGTEIMDASVTDEGEPFKVMATVMNIVKETWERREKLFPGENLDGFFFDPVAKPEEHPEDTSRARLYKTFIKKQFSGAEIKKLGSSYGVIPSSNTR